MTLATGGDLCEYPECSVSFYPGGHKVHDRSCAGILKGLNGPGCHPYQPSQSTRETADSPGSSSGDEDRGPDSASNRVDEPLNGWPLWCLSAAYATGGMWA